MSDQHDTLFDTGDTAWRLELRIKSGGGPFDPAGFSIQLLDEAGRLVLMEVTKTESMDRPIRQLQLLLEMMSSRLDVLLDPLHRSEVRKACGLEL